jgi:hypothetical protein
VPTLDPHLVFHSVFHWPFWPKEADPLPQIGVVQGAQSQLEHLINDLLSLSGVIQQSAIESLSRYDASSWVVA